MNAAAAAIVVAVTFTWLGMVLAISFLEAPLKFRAPGVTIAIGLGIGRLVFRALNLVEAILAVTLTCAVLAGGPPGPVLAFTFAADALLAAQIGVIRRRLSRRTDQVLAGADPSRSRTHLYYVAAEVAKVIALIGLGVSVLASALLPGQVLAASARGRPRRRHGAVSSWVPSTVTSARRPASSVPGSAV